MVKTLCTPSIVDDFVALSEIPSCRRKFPNGVFVFELLILVLNGLSIGLTDLYGQLLRVPAMIVGSEIVF